jgi:hypothetical protein
MRVFECCTQHEAAVAAGFFSQQRIQQNIFGVANGDL